MGTNERRTTGIGRRKVVRSTVLAVSVAALAATSVTASDAGARQAEASQTDASASEPAVLVSVDPTRVLDTRGAPNGPVGVAAVGKLGPNQLLAVDAQAVAVLAAQVGDDERFLGRVLDDRVVAMHRRVGQADVVFPIPADADHLPRQRNGLGVLEAEPRLVRP